MKSNLQRKVMRLGAVLPQARQLEELAEPDASGH